MTPLGIKYNIFDMYKQTTLPVNFVCNNVKNIYNDTFYAQVSVICEIKYVHQYNMPSGMAL